jgi:NAD(P)-dependent dehydrogenase (short-subunit alcohol dehydrogenase family)
LKLGLADRIVLVAASDAADRDACAEALRSEAARPVLVDSLDEAAAAVDRVVSEAGRIDGVVMYLPLEAGSSVLDADGPALLGAWTPVEAVAETFRAALPMMTERGRGRLVTVMTGSVKWLADDADERGAVAGLAVLGLHKAVVADAARFGVATNAVLREARSDPREVADTVTFLLSEPAAYLQGVTIGLDGATSTSVF